MPSRIEAGDYAYLVDAGGALREAVAVLGFDAIDSTISFARGVLDTTPQAHAAGTRLIGVGRWQAVDNTERAMGESVAVAAIPRSWQSEGAQTLAANGNPLVLEGRQARPYAPGRIRFNDLPDPATPLPVGDLVITWAHRDRTLQTAYLVQQQEGNIGPEPGTSYTVRIFNRDGALVRTAADITGTSFVWTQAQATADAGALGDVVRIEVSAQRAGFSSWQAQVRTVRRVV